MLDFGPRSTFKAALSPRTRRAITAWCVPVTDSRFEALTPSALFQSLSSVDSLAWLDCGASNDGWSYFGINPIHRHVFTDTCGSDHAHARPWLEYRRAVDGLRSIDRQRMDGPPYCGGWIGYLTYDSENLNSPASTINAALFDTILCYEHNTRHWWCAGLLLNRTLPDNISHAMAYKVANVLEHFASAKFDRADCSNCMPLSRIAVSNTTRAQYLAAVEQALRYITEGDIYQINLSQRFTVPAGDLTARNLYLNLRNQSPAAYGVFLGSGLTGTGQSICSISPELFLRVEKGVVTTRPIKGTRALGNSELETQTASCVSLKPALRNARNST